MTARTSPQASPHPAAPATVGPGPSDSDRTARIAFALLLTGALSIALSPIFVRSVLSEIGPTAAAFWRPALAIPVLWVWMALEPRNPGAGKRVARRPSSARDYGTLLLAGAFFAGDLIFWHLSIKYTSVANSTLLANVAPIYVALLSFLLFKERFSRVFVAGLALAVSGAVVLMGDSLSVGAGHLLGDSFGLITGLFYAAYILTVGRLRAHFSTATIMTWSAIATSLMVLPVALLSGETLIPQTLFGWSMVLGLAIITHAGGQSLIAYALAHLPASFSSVSLLVQPVAAAVLAWIIFGEALGPAQILGGAIVLGGISLARRGSSAKPTPPPT
ncbi:DMT family transporter [Inquilinus sp. CAU 1745]|uniref:DMT family transporter n=1 Tax=Inquilinus sp. CAU 1745 TaxID=3140369 RepID=UPI00325A5AF5